MVHGILYYKEMSYPENKKIGEFFTGQAVCNKFVTKSVNLLHKKRRKIMCIIDRQNRGYFMQKNRIAENFRDYAQKNTFVYKEEEKAGIAS